MNESRHPQLVMAHDHFYFVIIPDTFSEAVE